MSLKYVPIGKEMPIDFWNYNVNPIVGYKITDDNDIEREEKKYELKPQDLGI